LLSEPTTGLSPVVMMSPRADEASASFRPRKAGPSRAEAAHDDNNKPLRGGPEGPLYHATLAPSGRSRCESRRRTFPASVAPRDRPEHGCAHQRHWLDAELPTSPLLVLLRLRS